MQGAIDVAGNARPRIVDAEDLLAELDAAPAKRVVIPNPMTDEEIATSRLALAKTFIPMERPLTARKWLETLVTEYPKTSAAVEADQLLMSLPTRETYPQWLSESRRRK
jgi:hypothetical protein